MARRATIGESETMKGQLDRAYTAAQTHAGVPALEREREILLRAVVEAMDCGEISVDATDLLEKHLGTFWYQP